MNLASNFNIIIEKIFCDKMPKSIAVAVSGGCDSLALTILLNNFCKEKNIKLFAATIDHKIRKSSSKEASDLQKFLKTQKISHEILEIKWKEKPKSNIESKLRDARYELLHKFCKSKKIEFLFLGHILDDVAENFLIRLFRGSGIDGLSSISQISQSNQIKLVRPLLDFTKDEMKQFLQSKKIKWFEDETNLDEKFTRNKIRRILNEFDEENLIKKRIKNAADEIASARDIIDQIIDKKSKKVLSKLSDSIYLLDVKKFAKIEETIALKILALTLMEISGKIYKPRFQNLKNFYQLIIEDKIHKKKNFYGCMLEKASGGIKIYKEVKKSAMKSKISQIN